MRTNVCDTQSTTACYRDLTSWWVCNPFSSQTDNFLLVFTHPLNLLSEKNLSLSLAPFHLQLSLNKRFARLQSSNRAFDALLVPVTCIILLIRLLPTASSACAIAWRLMHSIILRWRRQVNTFLFRFFLFFSLLFVENVIIQCTAHSFRLLLVQNDLQCELQDELCTKS